MATELSIFRNEELEYDRLAELEANRPSTRRSIEEEIYNVERAGYLCLMGCVICLVSLVLSTILTIHHSSVFVAQTVWIGVSVLAFMFCFLWTKRVGNALKLAREPASLQITVVFLLSIFLTLYHLVQTMWIIIERPIHYNYLLSLRANQAEWDKRFGVGMDFATAWSRDKAIMTTLTVFEAVTAFSFAFIAYSGRSLHSQKYYLSRVALYGTVFLVSVAAWMGIYSAQETFIYDKIIPQNIAVGQNTLLKFYSCLVIVLALANAIVNWNRRKQAYLILALATFVMFVAVFSSTAIILHDSRQACIQDAFSNSDCTTTMATIHEKNLSPFCPTGAKYLPTGQTCKKEDLVIRWENLVTEEIRSLNPACCEVARVFYVMPYINLGYWGFIMLFSLATCAVFNIVLMDYDGSRLWVGRITRSLDLVSLGSIIMVFIIFIFYFIIRDERVIDHGTNPEVDSYLNPIANPIAGLEIVPDRIKAAANATMLSPNCFTWHADVYPTLQFDMNSSVCKTNCVNRLAIIVQRGSLKLSPLATVRSGGPLSKSIFFPGCNDSADSYQFFWGSVDALQAMLKGSTLCPATGLSPIIYMRQTQVPLASLGNDGLTTDERQAATSFAGPAGNSFGCGANFKPTNTSANCTGDCAVFFDASRVGVLEVVKGKLFFQDAAGKQYSNVPGTVSIEAFRDGKPVGGDFSLFEGGLWIIEQVMSVYNFSYVLTLNISDSSNTFLPNVVDILMPPEDVATTEFSAGAIRLLTANGTACDSSNGQCPPPLTTPLQGNVMITVDSEANTTLMDWLTGSNPTDVQVIEGHRVSGTVVTELKSIDINGNATIRGLYYGSYTILVNKTGYLPSVTFIDLQQQSLVVPPIILQSLILDHDMSVSALMTDPSIDYDLMLLVQNDKGYQCLINPLNKYCAYAMSRNDIATGVGEEAILIKKLAVANYMAYVAPAPPYDVKCTLGTESDTSPKHYQDLDWTKVPHFQSDDDKLGIIVNTGFGNEGNMVDPSGKPISGLTVQGAVETKEEANKKKRLLGKNGAPIPEDQNIAVSTDFSGKQKTPQVIESASSVSSTEPTSTVESEAVTESRSETTFDPTLHKTEKSISQLKTQATSAKTATRTESTLTKPLRPAVITRTRSRTTKSSRSESTSIPTQPQKPELTEESSYAEMTAQSANISSTDMYSKIPSSLPIPYPTQIPEEHLGDFPDTARFFNPMLDSEKYDDSLESTANKGDQRATITALREKEVNEVGFTVVTDFVKNLTQVTPAKKYESEYRITNSVNKIGTEKYRVVDFFGFTIVDKTKEKARETIAVMSANPTSSQLSLKDIKYFYMPTGTNVTKTDHHLVISGVANNQSNTSDNSCITKSQGNTISTVCNEKKQSLGTDGSKVISVLGGRTVKNNDISNDKDLKITDFRKILTNGTTERTAEIVEIERQNTKEMYKFREVDKLQGPLEDEEYIRNNSKYLIRFGNDRDQMKENNEINTLSVFKGGRAIYEKVAEMKNFQDFKSKLTKEANSEMRLANDLFVKQYTSKEENVNNATYSSLYKETKGYTELEENKKVNSSIENQFVEHTQSEGNRITKRTANRIDDVQYLDKKEALDNKQRYTYLQEKLATVIIRDIDEVLMQNMTKIVRNLTYFFLNNSQSNQYSAKIDSHRLNHRKTRETMESDIHNDTFCDEKKVCNSTYRELVTKDFTDKKHFVSLRTYSLINNGTSSIEKDEMVAQKAKEGLVRLIQDSREAVKEANGAAKINNFYEKQVDRNDSRFVLRKDQKIREVETIEGPDSATYSTRVLTKIGERKYLFPADFTTKDILTEHATIMKDKTFKFTIKSLNTQNPNISLNVDRVKEEKSYMISSLANDTEKPAELKEIVMKNENTFVEFAKGNAINKTIVHSETSRTDSQFNKTIESHVVTREMKDGSTVVRARETVGLKVLANNTIFTERNFSQTIITGDKKVVSWTYTKIQVNNMDDNKLLDYQSYPPTNSPTGGHLESRALENGDKSQRRVLQGTIKTSDLNKNTGSFILISCFTGFGKPSLIQMNQIVKTIPTLDQCTAQLKQNRPFFTIEALRAAYKENPGN